MLDGGDRPQRLSRRCDAIVDDDHGGDTGCYRDADPDPHRSSGDYHQSLPFLMVLQMPPASPAQQDSDRGR
jgi:hypothetical protein